jgi:membrane protease YdiL (CAAX protease family)
MTVAIETGGVGRAPRAVASYLHTATLAALMLVMAALGAFFQHVAASRGDATLPRPANLLGVYLPLLVMEWGLVLYIARGLRSHGVSLRDLIGGRWSSVRSVVTDVVLALGIWGVWTGLSWTIDRVLGPGHAASVRSMLPHAPLEIALWVTLSMSAGFSEELTFRGYFCAQFHALTGSVSLALVLQAILFGVTHGYQGVRACCTITLYGLLMGALAKSRGSLRPGVIAHAWTDVAAGIFRV